VKRKTNKKRTKQREENIVDQRNFLLQAGGECPVRQPRKKTFLYKKTRPNYRHSALMHSQSGDVAVGQACH